MYETLSKAVIMSACTQWALQYMLLEQGTNQFGHNQFCKYSTCIVCIVLVLAPMPHTLAPNTDVWCTRADPIDPLQ